MNLTPSEIKLYDGLAKIMEQDIVVPDLVIYLRSSTKQLLKNIRMRNRDFELKISEEYIDNLNNLYESFFSGFYTTPVLVLNTENYNLTENRDDFNKITGLISDTLKEKAVHA